MKITSLHPWPRDPQKALELQKLLAPQVSLKPTPLRNISTIAGADVSCVRATGRVWAAVLVFRLADMELIEEGYNTVTTEFPYIPGLLSFREIPVLIEAIRKLKQTPDAVICDGQGLAHPRLFGLACHLGLWLNLPTIGCAKKRLVGEAHDPGSRFGDWESLEYQRRTVGSVVRTRTGCKPVFISPGHMMDVPTARQLILACCRGTRLPEPTRLAHLSVNRYRKSYNASS